LWRNAVRGRGPDPSGTGSERDHWRCASRRAFDVRAAARETVAMREVTPHNVHDVLARWILADGMPLVGDLAESRGSYLRDARTGREFLDFFSFFATRALAYNHPGLVEPSFRDHLARVAAHKPSNCDVYTVEYAEFVDRLATVALGRHFRHLFFIEGGGPAVSNALKTAFDWKHRKNLAAGRGARGSQILHFRRAFHGRTGYALSVTESYDLRKMQYFPRFDWPCVTNPFIGHPFDDAARQRAVAAEATSCAEMNAAFDRHAHDIAAIIIEPVQCEGGDNYFRREFFEHLRRIADEREALLIFDEVQTGFGTTGAWWDWQHHGVKPDLMVFGKKTQVCGFAATERVDDVDGVFKVSSRISSTFEGNLVDMVRCTRIIDIVERDHLVDNARVMGARLLDVVAGLAARHPQVTAARGRGLLVAFDLPSNPERDAFLAACFEAGFLAIPCGPSGVRLRPALDVDAEAVDEAGVRMLAALGRVFGA
jgi:L-lysine 6-transaminase